MTAGPETAIPPSDAEGYSDHGAEDGSDGMQGLRDGLAALAGLPGAARERLGAERDAINGLRVMASQVVAGSQYVYNFGGGHSRIQAWLLPSEEIEEAREAFVAPDGFGGVQQSTEQKALTLLHGPAGTGKYAVAKAALTRSGNRKIFLLAPDTDLTALHDADLEPHADYILADLTQNSADHLTSFSLRRLGSRLAGQDCRLAITMASTLQITGAGVQGHLTPGLKSADGKAVVEAHLRWRMGPADAARATALLRRPDVRTLIHEALAAAPAAKGGDVGRLLAEAAAEGSDDEVAGKVRDRLARDDSQSLALWLTGMPDLATQCLALGTAVFGGEAYETVASLSKRLEELLQVAESPDNPDRPRGAILTGTSSARLSAIRATLVAAEVGTRYGGAHGRVVRYQDQGTAIKVLRHMWAEYDLVREALPTWLRTSAGNELTTVGVRAAVAAGVLAESAFERVRAQILVPWATDQRARMRDAAATALHVIAAESGHTAAACNLVFGWSADTASPRLRSTAARAWRVVFERDGAEGAFGLLHALAAGRENLVVEAVCRSVTEYMALDDGRYCLDALDLIAQWARGDYGPQHRLAGELAFLYAAADLVDTLPPHTPGGAPLTWPSLFTAGGKDGRIAGIIAALWAQALNSQLFASAHQVLAEWVVLMEPDPDARDGFADLMAAVAFNERTAKNIRYEAAKWVHGVDGRPAHRTAQAVLDRISVRRTFQ